MNTPDFYMYDITPAEQAIIAWLDLQKEAKTRPLTKTELDRLREGASLAEQMPAYRLEQIREDYAQ